MESSNGVLSGIRVVEAASIIMVPSTATILSDFGAEVIKVEPPAGDANRYLHFLTGMPDSEIAYSYMQLNRNKRGIVLDLKSDKGSEVLHRLLETADIFLTNYRPAALSNLKLGYEDLKDRYPRMIYAYGTGFGEEGSEADRPGFDVITYWGRSGIETSMFPYEGWLRSVPPGTGDHPSGLALYGAIMTALYRREQTGRGGKVSTSLLANGAWANSCLIQAQLCGATFMEKMPREESPNFTGLHYRTADDRMLKIAILEVERDWPALCRAVGRSELIEDPRFATLEARTENMGELIAILDEALAEHDLDYWRAALEEHDIPFAALPTYEEIAEDRQMAANGVFVEYDHPKHGRIRTVNSPFSLADEPKRPPEAAPELGQHTCEVLAELDYSSDEIRDLIERGAVAQSS